MTASKPKIYNDRSCFKRNGTFFCSLVDCHAGDTLVLGFLHDWQTTIFFRTIDSIDELHSKRLLPLTFLYDIRQREYIDKFEVYPYLRQKEIILSSTFSYPFHWEEICEIAILLARYHYEPEENSISFANPIIPLPPEAQQSMLKMMEQAL